MYVMYVMYVAMYMRYDSSNPTAATYSFFDQPTYQYPSRVMGNDTDNVEAIAVVAVS